MPVVRMTRQHASEAAASAWEVCALSPVASDEVARATVAKVVTVATLAAVATVVTVEARWRR